MSLDYSPRPADPRIHSPDFDDAPHLDEGGASGSVPLQSPSRQTRRPHLNADPLLTNLSPSVLLDALSPAQAQRPDIEARYGASLRASIRRATPSEREFGFRAATASFRLQEWCEELSAWEWPAEGAPGSTSPWEVPNGLERARKRVKVGVGDDASEESQIEVPWSNGTANLATANGKNVSHREEEQVIDDVEYWGGLPASVVQYHDERIKVIEERLEALELDELKSQALDAHVPSRSRRNSLEKGHEHAVSSYNRLEDLTALTTAMVLQSLPYMSRLLQLLNTWSTRLRVLRSVPTFFTRLEDANMALSSASNVTASLRSRPQSSHSGNGFAQEHDRPEMSRDDLETMRSVVEEKVSLLGKSVDRMLDALEGREETIPDKWIDAVERVEAEYSHWVVEAERAIVASEWRRKSQARSRQNFLQESTVQEGSAIDPTNPRNASQENLGEMEAKLEPVDQNTVESLDMDDQTVASPRGIIPGGIERVDFGHDLEHESESTPKLVEQGTVESGVTLPEVLDQPDDSLKGIDQSIVEAIDAGQGPINLPDADAEPLDSHFDANTAQSAIAHQQSDHDASPEESQHVQPSQTISDVLREPKPTPPVIPTRLSHSANSSRSSISAEAEIPSTPPSFPHLPHDPISPPMFPPISRVLENAPSDTEPSHQESVSKPVQTPLLEDTISEASTPGSLLEEYFSDPQNAEIADASTAGFYKPHVVTTPTSTRGSVDGSVRTPGTAGSKLGRVTPSSSSRRDYFEMTPPRMKAKALNYAHEAASREPDAEPVVESMPRRASVTSIESIHKGEVRTVDITRHGSSSSVSSVSSRRRPESLTLRTQLHRRSKDGAIGSPDTTISEHMSSLALRDEVVPHSPATSSPAKSSNRSSLNESMTESSMPADDAEIAAPQEPAVLQAPEPAKIAEEEHTPTPPALNETVRDGVAPPTKTSKSTLPRPDELDQKISSILNTIPAHIRLTTEADEQSRLSKPVAKPVEPSTPNPRLSKPQVDSPSFTLAPASSKAAPRHRSQNAPAQDVKLYHLRRAGTDAPIKLFVRLVGETGERVMVRVGGGWADLGEYLREYASHHGRRSASDGRIEVHDDNGNITNTPPTAQQSNGGSATPTPTSSNRPSPTTASTLNVRKTRTSSSRLSAAAPTTPTNSASPQSYLTVQEDADNSPASITTAAVAPYPRSTSRSSFNPEEMHRLGLAGPKSKKPDPLSPQKQAWVDGVIGQVRRASGGVPTPAFSTGAPSKSGLGTDGSGNKKKQPQRPASQTAHHLQNGSEHGNGSGESSATNTNEEAGSVAGTGGFKELNKAGGTTRVYRKGPLSQW
ncbi:MAG: hypothetical protein M4579_000231 [Chaenotheca gracillima]|nr:MAG: hypothetical protein M4579_000231 [Chaenotheca gracillima]